MAIVPGCTPPAADPHGVVIDLTNGAVEVQELDAEDEEEGEEGRNVEREAPIAVERGGCDPVDRLSEHDDDDATKPDQSG